MLVTFSGLDGAGKSTQIDLLNTHLQSLGHRVTTLTMYDHISVSAALRHLLRRLLRRNTPRCSSTDSNETSSSDRFRFDKNRSDPLTSLLRQIVYILDLCRFLMVRAYQVYQRRQILVMDRYFYDSIANVDGTTGWKALYARCFLALVPKPDLPILLNPDAYMAFRRKSEYPLEYMIQRRQVYFRIFRSVPAALIIDGEERPEEVHRLIQERIQALLPQTGKI